MLPCTKSRPCTRPQPSHTPQHLIRTATQVLAALATLVTLVIFCIKATKIYHASPISSFSYSRLSRKVITDQRTELSTDVVYFNDQQIMQQLGCPDADRATVHLNYTCFYHNPVHTASFKAEEILFDTGTTCAAIYKPQPADYGRPWCVRQTRTKHLTDQIPHSDRLHIPGLTLINGMLSGPNPTHQVQILLLTSITLKHTEPVFNLAVGTVSIMALSLHDLPGKTVTSSCRMPCAICKLLIACTPCSCLLTHFLAVGVGVISVCFAFQADYMALQQIAVTQPGCCCS